MTVGERKKSVSKPKIDMSKAGKRRCICCHKMFDSTGPENQICATCKEHMKDAEQRPFCMTPSKARRQLVTDLEELYSDELSLRFCKAREEHTEKRRLLNFKDPALRPAYSLPPFGRQAAAPVVQAKVEPLPLLVVVGKQEDFMEKVKLPNIRNAAAINRDQQRAYKIFRAYAGMLLAGDLLDGIVFELNKEFGIPEPALRAWLATTRTLVPSVMLALAWQLAGNLEVMKRGEVPVLWHPGIIHSDWAAAEVTTITRTDEGKLVVWMLVMSGPFAGVGLSKEVTGQRGLRMLRTIGIPRRREVPFEYLSGALCFVRLDADETSDKPEVNNFKCSASQQKVNKDLLAGRDRHTEETCQQFGQEIRCRECLCGRKSEKLFDKTGVCPFAVNLFPKKAEDADTGVSEQLPGA